MERLGQIERAQGLRALQSGRGIDFCSNDYLGFSSDPELKRRVVERLSLLPLGATGSRLIRGHSELFDQIETQLAEFSRREAALVFPSGYQANVGLFSALLRPGDMVFSDARNHASIIDGIRLGRSEVRVYPHKDIQMLRKMLEAARCRVGLKVIVSESLFSMDGDHAPLTELASLAEEFSASLIVDEAHATGLWGSGLVETMGLTSQVFATLHTGGKALGCGGAWIACDMPLKRYLINFSRAFIFSTAPLPFLAVALSEAVHHWKSIGCERAIAVHEKSAKFRNLLPAQAVSREVSGPIFPVHLGSNQRALEVSDALAQEGFDVRAIRPPTVPEGSARLRVTLQSESTMVDLKRLAQALGRSLQ
jgi:8-amino-7-oxononanoate synthase